MLSLVVGGFLLATAAWKTLSGTDAAALQAVYEIPRWLIVCGVQAEFLTGLLLVSGLRPRLAWQATVALFTAFAGFSLYRLLAGFDSCGCFGSLKIAPGWTLALDGAILAFLVRLRRDFAIVGPRDESRREMAPKNWTA